MAELVGPPAGPRLACRRGACRIRPARAAVGRHAATHLPARLEHAGQELGAGTGDGWRSSCEDAAGNPGGPRRPGRVGLVDTIVQAGAGACVSLAEPLSLGALAALLRRCSLLVPVDSGPLHLAATVGLPVVGLYGPVATAQWSSWCQPDLHRHVRVALPCSPCDRMFDPPWGSRRTHPTRPPSGWMPSRAPSRSCSTPARPVSPAAVPRARARPGPLRPEPRPRCRGQPREPPARRARHSGQRSR
jgi:Glycosyltransferase family 9 (heptosyltransferase)